MTREEAIQKHRKMWNWLADNPGKREEDYFEKFDPKAERIGDCYLCVYVAKHHDCTCSGCPVEWPGGKCWLDGALHDVWLCSMQHKDYTKAAKIARQIAELPEREEKC